MFYNCIHSKIFKERFGIVDRIPESKDVIILEEGDLDILPDDWESDYQSCDVFKAIMKLSLDPDALNESI